MINFSVDLAELGLVPDRAVRWAIRRLLKRRIQQVAEQRVDQLADLLRSQPLAVATDVANRQHYECPTEFFLQVLGPNLKYSCCLYDDAGATLEQAERAMLDLTCRRADLADGQQILELGCGWGSLTLWMAARYPASSITAVSNSKTQQAFIQQRAAERGLDNIRVICSDIRHFDTTTRFDRIVSVEMFEHVRNYEELFRRVAGWLEKQGQVFVHVFCHRSRPYLFESDSGQGRAGDWMSRHFFTGGTMPSIDLFDQFDDSLAVDRLWKVNGQHYARTCDAWLDNLDRHRDQLDSLLRRDLGPLGARRWLGRWRLFFMACSELFQYNGGEEWMVTHYLMKKADQTPHQQNSSRQLTTSTSE
ncbi:MAG: cyclopropane-fatty-acyl-phospholipid synthase [Pirellulaceae bacterium]|nr:MAG: cyclopropane-fatty-acyl-phospholipid synthase [Pirellulaceae bacterium]